MWRPAIRLLAVLAILGGGPLMGVPAGVASAAAVTTDPAGGVPDPWGRCQSDFGQVSCVARCDAPVALFAIPAALPNPPFRVVAVSANEPPPPHHRFAPDPGPPKPITL